MALVSPGVEIREISAGSSVVEAGSSPGAIVIDAEWGPVGQRTLITNESELVSTFGEPNDTNARRWFTAANFLSYVGSLYVNRAVDEAAAKNADDLGTGTLIKNSEHYESVTVSGIKFAARYPGAIGDSIQIQVCDSATTFSGWGLKANFTGAPGTSTDAANYGATNDELHIAVVDQDGLITGSAGTVLETYEYLSKAAGAKNDVGGTNYYVDVIRDQSAFIFAGTKELVTVSGAETAYGTTLPTASGAYASDEAIISISISGGVDGTTTTSVLSSGIQVFANKEDVDISVILTADGGEALGAATHVVADAAIAIANTRKDVIVCVSPMILDATGGVDSGPAAEVTEFTAGLTRSTYAFVDSGYKYQYDRYNDKYRWIPLNGDIGGLISRLDRDYEPWFSPAGFSRGQIQNAVKLAWNPNQTERDTLYKDFVNPVVSFPGQGTILYGDKMFTSKPGPFDRINVRRLFMTVEASVEEYAQGLLFELNDAFTRSQFVNAVTQYLSNIQSRRGLEDFRVIADTSNNTAQVINNNQFVGDILIRPLNSINFIRLNFIAVRSGVEFSEIAG